MHLQVKPDSVVKFRSNMDNIVAFPRPKPSDRGKARITRRRELIGMEKQGGPVIEPDNLLMLRADATQPPCDCA